MVIGALGGALTMSVIAESFPNASALMIVLSVIVISILFGVVYAALLAVACVNFNGDQTIVGTALNILGTAAAVSYTHLFLTAQKNLLR